jgi:effector-binding domain-containing protein
MAELATTLPPLHDRVLSWLGEVGVPFAGAPFWKYDVIDMAATLRVEVGVAVGADVPAGSEFVTGVLPAGEYAVATYVGHPAGLEGATGELLAWARQQSLKWAMHDAADGQHWDCRLEEYLTDPDVEPDLSKWQTRLAFKLA